MISLTLRSTVRGLETFGQRGDDVIVLVDGDKLVAFLSARDLMRAEVEGKDYEIESLTHYIHYVPPKTGE